LTEPRQVGTVNWDLVLRMLRAVDDGADVVADCGSVYGSPERMPKAAWAGADLVVLTVRPTLAGVHAARNAAAILREDLMTSGLGPDRLVSVVVGCAYGYPLGQVADELQDCAPVLGDLPYDPDAADTLGGLRDQRARFARSALLRHAGKIAASIGSRVLDGPATTDMEAPPAVVPPSPPSVPANALDRTLAPARGSSSQNAPHEVPSSPALPEWKVVPASPPPPVPSTSGGHTDATAKGETR
jgi:hypothetical protein